MIATISQNLTFKFSLKIIFLFLLLSNCIASSIRKLEFQKGENLNMQNRFAIHWIGFHNYKAEKKIIEYKLQSMGIEENPQAPFVLEIILEEQNALYNHKLLHFLNFWATLFSGSLIPYYTRTDHIVRIHIRSNVQIQFQSDTKLGLDQWRGILLLPFMPFYWPSSEFNSNLTGAIEEGLKTDEQSDSQ